MGEQICLQWNDFKDNVSTSFRSLRDDRDFAVSGSAKTTESVSEQLAGLLTTQLSKLDERETDERETR